MEIIELEHPLSQHYLTILRDKNTTFETFRLAASKLSYLLIIEATKELDLKDKQINTPLVETKRERINFKHSCYFSIKSRPGINRWSQRFNT